MRVPDLGYADDFALLATTLAGLQRLIDAAADFCADTGMIISTDETKVVVFSAGQPDQLPGLFQWLCAGVPLEWVARFKYLGTDFHATQGAHATYARLHHNMMGAWAQLQCQYGKLQCPASVGLPLRLYDAVWL